MKVTIDSSEPLADAIRVLAAMYDVDLVVSGSEPANMQASGQPAETAVLPRAKRARTKRAGSKRRSASKGKTTRPVKTASGAVSNAELRSWAAQNGFTVSDRGRLPAAVVAAYSAANAS